MRLFNKVYKKFVFASSVILIASLVIFTVVASSYFEKSITEFAQEELKRDTLSNADLISRFYDEKTRLAVSLSKNEVIINAAKLQAGDLTGPNPEAQFKQNLNKAEYEEITDFLETTYSHWSEELENMFLGDVFGYAFADPLGGLSVGILLNADVRGGNFWTKAMNGEEVFGDLEFSPVPGRGKYLVSVIAVPIKDGDDVVGMIGLPVTFNPIGETINSRRTGESGANILIDRFGNLLVHSNPDYILKKKLSDLGGDDLKQISQGMMNMESGFGTFVLDNVKYQVYYHPVEGLSHYKGQGLSVASIISEHQLLEKSGFFRKSMFLFILTTIILSSLIIYLISRLITKPINNLRNAALEISRGNLETKIFMSGKDEVGELAVAFNDMSAKLNRSYKSLSSEKVKLTNNNLLLKILLNNLPIGVVLMDPNNKKLLLINETWKSISGKMQDKGIRIDQFSETYNLKRDDGKIYPNSELPFNMVNDKKSIVTKKDIVILNLDGKKVRLSATAAPVRDKSGKIIQVVTIFEDVTEAFRIDRAKTEFVSLASHQLRTPLSAMKWYTEMLVDGDAGKLTHKQHDFVNEILKSSNRMVDLVSTLLNVSRIELGTFAIDPKPTDLLEVIKFEAKQLLRIIDLKKLKYSFDHPTDAVIALDKQLISIIVQNLLSNAVRYTPEGGEIKVKLEQNKTTKEWLISVTDTGYGIPKKEQTKIFSKLYRAENVKIRDTNGTGLGLYIVKSILDEAGCKIWFDSVENKGSTFNISIPATGMKRKTGPKNLSILNS